MEEDLIPSAAADLIEKARVSRGISVRKAARVAGLSEGRWRQIAKGYQQVTSAVRAPVNAPPETLARMARAVGLPRAAMEEAGAAEVVAAMEALEQTQTRVDRGSSLAEVANQAHYTMAALDAGDHTAARLHAEAARNAAIALVMEEMGFDPHMIPPVAAPTVGVTDPGAPRIYPNVRHAVSIAAPDPKESDQHGRQSAATTETDDDFLSTSSVALPLEPERTATPQPGAQSGHRAPT